MDVRPKVLTQTSGPPIERAPYERTSRFLLGRKHKITSRKWEGEIGPRLEDMFYGGSEVYLVMGIRNRSGIDFGLDHLEVFRA